MDISGRVFVVTGGASGLGAASARMLVDRGAHVVLADLNDVEGEALARELAGAAHYVHADVADERTAAAAIGAATERFGTLSGLVHCAGIATAEKVLGKEGPQALAAFARIIAVNLVGSFNMLRLAAQAMTHSVATVDGERGVIVLTASVAAFDGQIGQAAYSAAKAGVAGMTLPIARELARYGIRVMTIAPGLFETPMMASLPAEARAALGATVPFPPRLGRPTEFASLVCEIIENSMLNGEVIRLDGALRMAAR